MDVSEVRLGAMQALGNLATAIADGTVVNIAIAIVYGDGRTARWLSSEVSPLSRALLVGETTLLARDVEQWAKTPIPT